MAEDFEKQGETLEGHEFEGAAEQLRQMAEAGEKPQQEIGSEGSAPEAKEEEKFDYDAEIKKVDAEYKRIDQETKARLKKLADVAKEEPGFDNEDFIDHVAKKNEDDFEDPDQKRAVTLAKNIVAVREGILKSRSDVYRDLEGRVEELKKRRHEERLKRMAKI